MPAENKTYTSVWTLTEYTIAYDYNGGAEDSAANPVKYTIFDAFEFRSPTREHYDFQGWYETLNGTEVKVAGIEKGSTRNVSVKAKWTAHKYVMKFEDTDGRELYKIEAAYGEAIEAPEDPTKEGYVFAGWSEAAPVTMPGKDTTLRANWQIVRYELTIDYAGGTGTNPADYAIETENKPTKIVRMYFHERHSSLQIYAKADVTSSVRVPQLLQLLYLNQDLKITS